MTALVFLKNVKYMEKEEKKLSGVATPEQIAMWKNLHCDVFTLTVGNKIAYLKRPDRKTMQAADALGSADGIKYHEVILENCWLGGDTEIKTNDSYFLQTISTLDEIVNYGRAVLKKL